MATREERLSAMRDVMLGRASSFGATPQPQAQPQSFSRQRVSSIAAQIAQLKAAVAEEHQGRLRAEAQLKTALAEVAKMQATIARLQSGLNGFGQVAAPVNAVEEVEMAPTAEIIDAPSTALALRDMLTDGDNEEDDEEGGY